MNKSATLKIVQDGLWNNNPATVQILGLCPLLAVTTTLINGLGMGLATTLVLMSSNVCVSLIRHVVRPELRIPVFVLVIASMVTSVELLMHAFFYDLYNILGIFIPLIVTNCTIIARAEAFASKNAPLPSLWDGLSMGLGFTVVLVLLGGMREFIGLGTVFSQAHLMFGEAARNMSLHLFDSGSNGLLIAILPPGAFLGLGLIIALKNTLDNRFKRRAALKTQPEQTVPISQQPAAN